MKFFEDHDQFESFLERFVNGWQVALQDENNADNR